MLQIQGTIKVTINHISKKDKKSFQYAVTVALNHEEIRKPASRTIQIKPFTNKYKLEGIKFPSKIDDWKIFEKNNVTIAVNVLCVKKNENHGNVSKNNPNAEKKIILFMIQNGENSKPLKTLAASGRSEGREAKSEKRRWHYLAVKKSSPLLRGTILKNSRDFHCLNCLLSFVSNKKQT